MNRVTASIPLVDFQFQHQPIAHQLEQMTQTVIQQGDYILGSAVEEFEQAFAHLCGRNHGIGVGSGTDAITLGLQACGIGHGDEVIMAANAFVGTLLGVLRAGAVPILVDCDLETGLLDLTAAEKAITARTRAIVPSHLYGQMVSPRLLLNLAGTYDLLVLEDATQAHLAEREGYRAGSVGMAAAFSFYPSKNLGAFGDGGMIVTHEAIVAKTAQSLRSYGAIHKHFHTDYGMNSRLDTLQAAVLQTKLPYLPAWNAERVRIAQQYDALLQPLDEFGIVPIVNQSGSGHAYYLYVIRVTTTSPIDRSELQAALANLGIQTGIHYPTPCHLQPVFRHLGYQSGDFPQAETLSQEVLSLPLYPGLRDNQIEQVVAAIEQTVRAGSVAPIVPPQSKLQWEACAAEYVQQSLGV